MAAVGLLVFCCGVFVACTTVRMVLRCWMPVPIEDQWQQLVSGRDISWNWLTSQHNEHRILLPRFVFMVDRWLFRERNIFDLAVNLVIQSVACILLIRTRAKNARPDLAGTALGCGFVLSMLFWSVQWENFTWGFQVQFFGVTLGAAIVFLLVAFGRRTPLGLFAILVAMTCTTFTLASGFAAAFIAVPLAVLVGRPRRDASAIGIMAVALLGLYLHGYHHIVRDPEAVTFATWAKRFGVHVLVDLGGPIGAGLHALVGWNAVAAAGWAGAWGLVAFAAVAAAALRRDRSPASMTLLALGCFVLTAVGITAVGRAVFGPEQAMSSRYASPVLVFWVALAVLVEFAAERRPHWVSASVRALPVALTLLAVGSQDSFSGVAAQTFEARFEGLPALAARVMDVPRLRPIQNDPHETFGYLGRLKAAKTSFYADPWLDGMGERLGDRFESVDPSRCRGVVTSAERVGEAPTAGWRVVGRVGVAGIPGQIRLVLTDAADRIAGFALVPPLARQAAEGNEAGWVGYVAGDAPDVITPHVLLPGNLACSLGSSDALFVPGAELAPVPTTGVTPGGWVDVMSKGGDGDTMVLAGWTLTGNLRSGVLRVDTDMPVTSLAMVRTPRPDVAAALGDAGLGLSGFRLTMSLAPGTPAAAHPRLCLWTDDPSRGRHVLSNRADPGLCPAAP